MSNVSCKNCALANLCLPYALSNNQLQELDKRIKRKHPIKRGEALYHIGEEFQSIYVIRSGAFKSLIDQSGYKQITNFFLPGEVIGFEGMANKHYITTTVALTDSFVCEVGIDDLSDFAQHIPDFQKQIFNLMSQEISLNTQAHFHGEAAQKLLHFLLQLAERFRRRGLSPKHFELPMPKQDIGNYLGIANETISRLFNKLETKELISVSRRQVTLYCLDNS